MYNPGRDLGEEIEGGVRAHGHNRGDLEAKDQNWQQQDAPAQPGKANQETNHKSDQDFSRDQFHRNRAGYLD